MSERGAAPIVGSAVQYLDEDAEVRAAIVLHVQGEHARRLWLRVLCPGHTDYERHWVRQGDERGTWRWPKGGAPME